MTRRAAFGCAVVLATLGVLGMPSTAQAASTPNPHINVKVDHNPIRSGRSFTVSSHANTVCDWIIVFAGDRRHTIGRTNTSVFMAPDVTKRTRYPLVVRCIMHSPPAPSAARPKPVAGTPRTAHQVIVVQVPPNSHVVVPVVVDPNVIVKPPQNPGGGGHGGLPNTGGPSSWRLLLGFALVLIGAVVVRRTAGSGQLARSR